MRIFLAPFLSAILLAQLLCAPSVFAQGDVRPRRSQTTVEPSPPSTPPKDGQWQTPSTSPVTSADSLTAGASKNEPVIRVALATGARSASISTTGHLTNATDVANSMVALDVARVRLEPRLFSPLPAATEEAFRLSLAALSSRADAEQKAREVKEATNEDSQITLDNVTKTWGLLIGDHYSQPEAEELRAQLLDAAIETTILSLSRPGVTVAKNRDTQAATSAASVPSNVRLASSRPTSPSREVVAFAAGSGRLFSSSAPVMFGSDDEKAPVRFNDKPYRGRIEVFANTRGALTVVNVIGLEDYVKGVVPNELSAGGYPLIEAHKAQAIAARTYALRNRGQFISQGYDLLPTTRSQVYRGLTSENALSSRAVDETRGMVATYNGEPINALYTSTCGGRTEDAANIFNDAVPYLKGRECAAEGHAALAPFIVKTSREPAELKTQQNVALARDVALLAVQNFTSLRARVSDSWLDAEASVSDVRSWLASVARLAHQTAPTVTEDVNRPPAFATALSTAVYGESRADTLLNNADVEYFLAVRDAGEIPPANRADVAQLLRDGYFSVFPDATLRPREPLSRGRALHSIARILEARSLLQLQRGSSRPTADDNLVMRSTKGKDLPVKVSADAFLFRQIGESLYPVSTIALVGGEPVVFHVNGAGEVDYLEVRPSANGAAADRFSPFTNWTTYLTPGQAQARLGRYAAGIGSLTDLRVIARGSSRRATDLEMVGTQGTAHVRGGRIRSALGLREQLFVIERRYGEDGRVVGFTFLGRGWGHGVGMCQVGAYGLARQGFTYEQILKAYYTGIELTRMY
ncbi:MAG TPA: SpoIID/LytB domain-containing protein [Pyrinomonadaceae bacterium]|nr:SpoIID/LytB domain-containing protein [Pyrinomonadaceae bacterium]